MGIFSFLFGRNSNTHTRRKKSLHDIHEEISTFTDEAEPEEQLCYAFHVPFKLPLTQNIGRGLITTYRQAFMI